MKRNSLSTAVVAGLVGIGGLAGVANAVNVNPEGVGQVLLYPYYTVNGGNATLMSIVNTTAEAKAVKVRFLEALNSAEVLDFNLYLSPFDVWTGSVVRTDGGASLFTTDTSCTVPNNVGKTPGGTAFLPFEFNTLIPSLNDFRFDIVGLIDAVRPAGPSSALAPLTVAERLRQGHMEVIEMGSLLNEGAPSNFNPRAWTIHAGAAGARVPNNCPALEAAWASNGQWTAAPGRAVNFSPSVDGGAPSTVTDVTDAGGLFGGATIVDVEFGRALSYNAEAIDGFYLFQVNEVAVNPGVEETIAGFVTTIDLHRAPGSVRPDLRDARTGTDPVDGVFAQSNVFDNGTVVSMRWLGARAGLNAVSSAFMTRFLYNEFNMQESLDAASEWVVTFPTKRLHTRFRLNLDNRPFSDNTEAGEQAAFVDGVDPFDTFGICEAYTIRWWDREERTPTAQATGPIVSPPPPGQAVVVPQLCWEANIIAFNQDLTDPTTATEVLGASARQGAHGLNINVQGTWTEGWARIEFRHPLDAPGDFRNYLVSNDTNPIAVLGLPTIGFWAADYLNENVGAGIRANFAGIHKHRGDRDGRALGAGATAPAFGTPINAAAGTSWTEGS